MNSFFVNGQTTTSAFYKVVKIPVV